MSSEGSSGSGSGSTQSAASQLTKIQSQLECPVCLKIPRDLPLPSCPSGHIVCRPCKERVRDYPTCRQPMPANMTNSLAAGLIDQVQHRCKFSDQGCDVMMMLKDLVAHEKNCPERTIEFPYSGCAQEVKLKNFNTHAFGRFNFHSAIFSGTTVWFTILEDDVIYHQAGLEPSYQGIWWNLPCQPYLPQSKQMFCVQHLACQESKCCIHVQGNPQY